MKSPKMLSASQLAQRIDELQELIDPPQDINKRLESLKQEFEQKQQSNFNQGVISPLPPDNLDTDNEAVVTPKSPLQANREYESWLKQLDT